MNILFEIGMEEIPARFLSQALNDLKGNLEKKLTENRIKFDNIKTFGTPRRLVLLAEGVAEQQENLDLLNMGPAKNVAFDANGEISRAGAGFAKSQGVEPKDLEIIETPKGEYIAVRKFVEGQPAEGLLPEILKSLVLELSFPKPMKWSDKQLRFARPIQWFLALADDKVVEFEIEGIKSGNKSRGHRFFGKEFTVENIPEYFEKLAENNVVVDIAERKALIEYLIEKECTNENEQVLIDPELLNEVTNLVEYPFPIVGTFNSDFLEVPQDVLIISMQTHQRYFPILDKDGKLLPKFVVIRNGIEGSEQVRIGNEKVLSARLADARFFYQEDLKQPLSNNIEKLKNVVFQKDLGTIYDKVERIAEIASYITTKLGAEDKQESVNRTVYLAKADLVSNMIGEKEFTKLQGFMGADYALKSGETAEVSKGIEEHYYPRFQGDVMPQGLEGVVTGIADRLDTLVGCFGVGIIPSGSKDPFALRRAALGIVNIILNSNLELSLNELVDTALETLQEKGVLKRDRAEVKKEVMEFFKQRALNVFTEMGYRRDVINAVLAYDYDNLTEALEKIKVLEEVSKEESFGDLVALLKRVGNITKDHKDVIVDTNLFKEEIENELFTLSTDLDAKLIEDLEGKLYREYLERVLASKDVINRYFENVMVMDKDEAVKNNRLSQLKFLNNIFGRVADLTLIEA